LKSIRVILIDLDAVFNPVGTKHRAITQAAQSVATKAPHDIALDPRARAAGDDAKRKTGKSAVGHHTVGPIQD
jgi:hypothetical protein